MLLTICFILGVANFYMHKAVTESDHPFVTKTRRHFGTPFGPYASYALELVLLIGALWLANTGSLTVSLLYTAYTAINGVACWLLLSNKA